MGYTTRGKTYLNLCDAAADVIGAGAAIDLLVQPVRFTAEPLGKFFSHCNKSPAVLLLLGELDSSDWSALLPDVCPSRLFNRLTTCAAGESLGAFELGPAFKLGLVDVVESVERLFADGAVAELPATPTLEIWSAPEVLAPFCDAEAETGSSADACAPWPMALMAARKITSKSSVTFRFDVSFSAFFLALLAS
jgi:hypothetical protein